MGARRARARDRRRHADPRRRAARPLAGARDPHAGPLLPRVPARGPHRPRAAPRHHPPARGGGDRAHVPSRRTRCRAALRLDLRTRARGRARDAHRSTRAPGARGPPGRPDDLRCALMPRSAGLTSRERVRRALRGDAVDRPPFAVWRHFYPDENEGAERLAGTTIDFTTRHRLDIVKYNPRAHYHAEPWGTAYRYAGAETFAALARACVETADGIFLATTSWAQRDTLDQGEYARFGRPFDLRVLAGARGAALNVLHVCGPNARVVELARYDVAAVSWNPHLAGNPNLAAFQSATADRGALGGLSDSPPP